MQGLSGLGGVQAGGLQPAQASSAMSGLQAQGMPGMDLSTITANLPDSWLSPDLKAGTIDWSMFNPISVPSYEAVLNTAYKPKPVAPQRPPQNFSLSNFLKQKPVTLTESYFSPLPDAKPKPKPKPNTGASDWLDRSQEQSNGISGIVYNQQKQAYDQAMGKMRTVGLNDLQFADPKIQEAYSALRVNQNYTGKELSQEDLATREQRINDVSSRFGFTPEQLSRYITSYDKARGALNDPVGANWQDIKNTGDFYKNQVLPGVRRYSGYNDAFFNKLNQEASEGTRNSQRYLSPEYFALHTVSPNVQSGRRELIGNTNPKLSNEWWAPGYNNNPGIALKRKVAGIGTSNPYAATDWQDYLPTTVSRFDATPEQRAVAEADNKKYRDLLSAKVEDGGQFNLWRETGTNPYLVTKTPGGKWKPRNSGYTNQLNIAQNFLPQATEGKRNFRDVGYNENDAYRSGFYFDKKKKKFGALGGILSLASFIPGPIGVGARILNTVTSLANKDYFGALTSGLGAYGKLTGTNFLGGIADKIGSSLGVSPSVANAIVQGGMGGLGAVANKGDFVKGALGGGLGSYAGSQLGMSLDKLGIDPTMAGAISGGVGSAINGTIQGANGLPLLSGVATGAVSGWERGRNIRNNRDRNVRR